MTARSDQNILQPEAELKTSLSGNTFPGSLSGHRNGNNKQRGCIFQYLESVRYKSIWLQMKPDFKCGTEGMTPPVFITHLNAQNGDVRLPGIGDRGRREKLNWGRRQGGGGVWDGNGETVARRGRFTIH